MKPLLFFIVALLGYQTSHADPKSWMLLMNQGQQFRLQGDADQSVVPESIFKQKLNHDDANSTAFDQRYWIEKKFAKGANSPVLFYICGEGECGSGAFYGAIGQHAKSLGAAIVALEHRFYGKSQPFQNLETQNLKHLTVHQSLLDFVEFSRYAKKSLGLNGKWIAIGGSYSGALAAYLRTLYPNDFVGALSSSGPVRADDDFSEYDRHVAIQAGPKCLAAIHSVVKEVEEGIKIPKRAAELRELFDASVLKRDDDFLYLLADVAAAAVQYGMKDDFCDYVESDGLSGYVKGAELVSQLFGNLTTFSAQAGEDTSLDGHNGTIGIRQWFYQSCQEFGFWQNAWPDPALSARSTIINEAYHAELCHRLFNIQVPVDIEKTNRAFYDPIFESGKSNILFTNGEEDPWMNLAITQSDNPDFSVMIMTGAAHCDDLGDSQNPSVILGQELFLESAKKWLK